MSDVDVALERAENDPPAESWRAPMRQVVRDRAVLAAEVKRLRGIHEKIAVQVERMRSLATALGIEDTEGLDDENRDSQGRPSTDSLLGIAPDWTGGKSVDDYIDDIRRDE